MIYKAPVNDMMFLFEEWIGLEKITELPGFEDLDSETLRFVLEEAGKFCALELLPINREGDEHGALFADGEVSTPPGFREAYAKYIEGGWPGLDADPEHGGQGLPKLVQFMVDEMLASTNQSFKLYCELTHGAYHLLDSCAPEEIRERYLPKMVEGAWSGTMCLTEPHCGTDLGLLNTRAQAGGDGSYDITGSKIFITSGDHDLTENILHMVLARIEGAPAGSRGISLFLVPRTLVNADGSLGSRNAVTTGSIEHKMGIKASATCALNFEGATGYLVGEENRGLAAMFKMMNLERITVGIQGLAVAEIAYQNAVAYALERTQGKAPKPRPDDSKAADPIIHHPEIRRMLAKIRAQADGARALAVYAGYHADVADKTKDPARSKEAGETVAMLTPVLKSHLTDMGLASALSAQQVFGGHGYIREHGMEQLVRDVRITQMYEGTNEVQALDLVMRKLTADGGGVADRFLARWQRFFQDHANDPGQESIVGPASKAFTRLLETTAWMRDRLAAGDAAAQGAATDYQRLFALTIIACLWADIWVCIEGKQGALYTAKEKRAVFYMQHILPETESLQRVITGGSESLASMTAADFVD